MSKSKDYIIDTNALLESEKTIEILMNGKDGNIKNKIFVPYTCIEELDGLKNNIRLRPMVMKTIDSLNSYKDDIIVIKNGYKNDSNDNKILQEVEANRHKFENPIFVTNDKMLQFKVSSLDIPVEPFKASNPFQSDSELWTGFTEELDEDEINSFYFKEGVLYFWNGKREKSIHYDNMPWNINPRDIYQNAALELILDRNIPLVSIQSSAGKGKTWLSLASALEQILAKKIYKKLYIFKNVVEIGPSLGYLPGPQPLSAKILTPTGWTTMGDIKVGDYVIGKDGKKAKVYKVFDHGIKDVYKIETSNGSITEACGDHLWSVKNHNDLKHNKPFRIKTTLEIKDDLLNKNTGPKYNYSLPFNDVVNFNNNKKLPIFPYTLGVLLGDGCLNDNISFSSIDNEIIENVRYEVKKYNMELYNNGKDINYNIKGDYYNNKPARKVKIKNIEKNTEIIYNSIGKALKNNKNFERNYLNYQCNIKKKTEKYEYSFIDKPNDFKYTNYIKNEIYNLGLLYKKSWEKFIPDIYKYTSVENRLEIIRGILDTDGNIKKDGYIELTTTSKRLCDDIIEILRSLGINSTSYKKDRIGTRSLLKDRFVGSKRITYQVCIPKNDFVLFKLSRKANRTIFKNKSTKNHNNKITNIEYIGKKEVRCISIDNKDNLYITDDFIITHNSVSEKINPFTKHLQIMLDQLHELRPGNNDVFLEQGVYNSKYIEILPLTYIRGMNLEDSFVIIEESQNNSREDMRSLLTRMGKNCKCICIGDTNQVDSTHLNQMNNGLNWIVKKFRGHNHYAHIVLKGNKSRGPICDLVLERRL